MPKVIKIVLAFAAALPVLLLITSFIANYLFTYNAGKEVKALFNNIGDKKEIVRETDLEGLPHSVQNWLERSQVIGKERIKTVYLKQKGLMRTTEDGKWMPAEAKQYFRVDEPGFIWTAKIRIAPAVYLAGRDKYYEGKGHMLIKLLSLIPIADSKGEEIDQGTLLRYMAEMPWFPTAALSNYIKWEEVDFNRARAIMSYGGVTASGVYEFNEKGEVVSFTANRYREVNGSFVLQDWGGLTREYREFNGIRIPNKTDVVWKPETGDFTWYKLEVTEIEYNGT
ncbi:DUF6544 family protein [Phosphitispora fastidiosa]|uniref:DUF6544 family protein n=1 Tax=Phosphitispora fastidiosa TaxID=2837202 RepID=UPI001E62F997|nr:DUF6544 family protein [Phosphitispora fastidiosa]MBU7006914.1 hypothetical protein [Phosphitispora fastidiosa]